jgi:hypothetical protein
MKKNINTTLLVNSICKKDYADAIGYLNKTLEEKLSRKIQKSLANIEGKNP